MVGIPSSSKRTITKKIDFLNYEKNGDEGKDKWDIYSDGGGWFVFHAISDEKEFDNDRKNSVSIWRR